MTNSNSIFTPRSEEHVHSETAPGARLLLRAISWYQGVRVGRIAPCRFHPSCSHYAYEAIEIHGAFKGCALALRRISRCRPFGPHGIDLVPIAKKDRTPTS